MIEFEHRIQPMIVLDVEGPLLKRDLKALEGSQMLPIEGGLEEYIFHCGKGLIVLMTSIDKAAFCIDLLQNASELAVEGGRYNLAEQIGFAIENYYIRSAAVYDRALIFVNKLLELGIADEAINHEAIITNSHVVNANIGPLLKSLRKACMEHRTERNAIIHHRSYSEESFDQLSMIHAAQTISARVGSSSPFDDQFVATVTQAVLDVRSEEFADHMNRIWVKISALLDHAVSIYQQAKCRHKKLAS